MKTISIGYLLTRDAMKDLKGGLGQVRFCSAKTKEGYQQSVPGICEGSREACNSACRDWCSHTEGCASCSCG